MKVYVRLTIGMLLIGLLAAFLVSCGDDGTTNAGCENCDFWETDFGGVGRFPAASSDPEVIAFCSRYIFPAQIESPFDPGDLPLDDHYHVWIAETEAGSDTVWYHQITSDDEDDFVPKWSEDDQAITFERNVGGDNERQVFVVEVSDFDNPGTPVQVTDEAFAPPVFDGTPPPHISTNPSWTSLAGHSWIAFSVVPLGKSDADIALLRYPGLDDTVWVSIDPADFARDENGVMSFTFRDQHPSGSGSNLVAFASPDRVPVTDIEVLATSQEQEDSMVVVPIFVNDRPSDQFTPYTFHYRPVGIEVYVSGSLERYCSDPGVTLLTQADTTNTVVLDFVYTHGTLALRSAPGGQLVFLDGRQVFREGGVAVRTPGQPGQYVYLECVSTDTSHSIALFDVYGRQCGETVDTTVAAGDTTFLAFTCMAPVEPLEGIGSEAYSQSLGGAPPVRTGQGPAELLTQDDDSRSIWLADLGEDTDLEDDQMLLVQPLTPGANFPAVSPDGKYVAYIQGEYTSWEIAVADVTPLLNGTGPAEITRIGLPGSPEDIECWRQPEKISWLPLSEGRKIVVSLSPCRGGQPADCEIWVADLDRFLD